MMIFRDTKSEQLSFAGAQEVTGAKQIAQIALAVAKEIISERRANGALNPELVPVVCRGKRNKRTGRPIVRTFNLSAGNVGRSHLAESLISGSWRLASDAEIRDEEEFTKKQKIKKLPRFLQKEVSASIESED